jgi:hypothetical protein
LDTSPGAPDARRALLLAEALLSSNEHFVPHVKLLRIEDRA